MALLIKPSWLNSLSPEKERMSEVELSEWFGCAFETGPGPSRLNERKRLLEQAIQQLSEEQRDVLLLRFMEGIDI